MRISVVTAAMVVAPCWAYEDVFFFYERTVYLEHLLMPGAWWANPALPAELEHSTLQTINASPLGDRYTISSVRFFRPLLPVLTVGMGILGVGEDQTGSLSADPEGVSYRSSFFFSRPSVQTGAAVAVPYAGRAGVGVSFGAERISTGIDHMRTFPTLGMGAGWLSPKIAGMVDFSASVFLLGHFLSDPYWNRDAKLGLRLQLPDELVRIAVEYSFPFEGGFRFRTPRRPWTYEVLKAVVSVRIYRALGVVAGFSSDFHSADDPVYYPYFNGDCLHGGLELAKSDLYPFFGGYEVGVSVDGRWNVIHHVWVGMQFRGTEAQTGRSETAGFGQTSVSTGLKHR